MAKQTSTGHKTPAKGQPGTTSPKSAKPAKPLAKQGKPVAKAAPKPNKPPAKPAAKAAPRKPAAPSPAKAPANSQAKPSKAPAAKPSTNNKTQATAPKGGKPVVPAAAAKPTPADAGKAGRKGITIVDNKPAPKKGKKEGTVIPSFGGGLLRPGGPARKPLIQSGPHAPAAKAWKAPAGGAPETPVGKSPFNKKELARFREILVRKRSQLVGDVSHMEDEALRSGSGSLSNLPQHMADQGSDAYDQALSLDIAAADRRLIKEIDDAIGRIDNGTYGVCQLTGKPIRAERLEELPWARYSIEAARELERRPNRM